MDFEKIVSCADDIYSDSRGFSKPLNKKEESVIMQVPYYAITYAECVKKGRWLEMEPFLLKNSIDIRGFNSVLNYCIGQIKGRWVEFEEVLLRGEFDCNNSWKSRYDLIVDYAEEVIGGSWPLGEEVIKDDYESSYAYSLRVLEGRFLKGEGCIAKSIYASKYSENIIKGRWIEAEDDILNSDFDICMEYLENIIKGRWIEFEEMIKNDSNKCIKYVEVTKVRWVEFEERMLKLKSPKKIIRYLEAVDKIGVELHNKMLMLSFSKENKSEINHYFHIIEEKKRKETRKLKNIGKWLDFHRGKSVEDVLDFINNYEYNHTV